VHNDYALAELTQRVEAKELGITCGFADRYVRSWRYRYIDYRGKLHHRNVRHEPYATYERRDTWVDDYRSSPSRPDVLRDSGDVHSRMRHFTCKSMPSGYDTRGTDAADGTLHVERLWETAWRGKIALLERDWEPLHVDESEPIACVQDMMAYCGLVMALAGLTISVSRPALKNGVGRKLTGGGRIGICARQAGL